MDPRSASSGDFAGNSPGQAPISRSKLFSARATDQAKLLARMTDNDVNSFCMTATAPTDSTATPAQLTVGRINSGMDAKRVPMVGQILRIISDISGKSERMSVGDLVEFINAEPTIVGRIVTIASSVGYNAGNIEINSIHHAVSLIGFDQVRTLTVSILLLEGAHSQGVAQTNRELAATSLISGLVAAEICRRRAASDPDMAFICGALRNYGRMLAATFMAEEYAATLPSGRSGAEESFRTFFGLTPLELGREVMTGRLLPKSILNTLVGQSPQDRRYCCATATGTLTGAADFGLRFAELLQGADLRDSNFDRRIEELSREYDQDFYLSRPDVRELVEQLVSVLACFRCRAGSYAGSVSMFRRLESLAAERVLPMAVEMVIPPLAPRPPVPVIESADGYDI